VIIETRQIIEELAKQPKYKSICIKIAVRQDLADDLYQEFFLSLLNIKDDRLTLAYEGKYLEVFCYGIIHNIWSMRGRCKKYENGSTSPLYNATDNIYNLDMFEDIEVLDHLDPHTALELLEEADISKEDIIKQVEKDKTSTDRTTMFRAHVFYQSMFNFKNPRKFAEVSNIPYRVVLHSFNEYKSHLNKQLCKS
jgi:DNA-directed RNA polymerase specialized sigma24 family protein